MIRTPHASGFFAYAFALAFALLLSQSLQGCGQTVEVGIDDALVSGGGAAAAGVGGNSGGGLALAGIGGSQVAGGSETAGTASTPACVKTQCRGKPYACGDCLDNDRDGKIDSEDPDCLGPCDNDETNLSTGLTVGNGAPCKQDCYFDGDAGPGNDKCQWTHQCDTLSVAPDYPPSGEARCAFDESKAPAGTTCADLRLEQPAECVKSCLPLAPNGCDCFGCCELPAGSNSYRFIGSVRGSAGCELDSSGDPTNCPPCTPVRGCLNECKRCENCVGRGADPDPACGGSVACPPGQAACSTNEQCDFAEYCVTGCCVRPPEPT